MKKLIAILLCVLCACTSFTGCEKKSTLKKVTVNEVAHSIFYAPQYVAMEKGYFKEEGLKLDVSMISGANNVTAAVLSGDIDIGFCGPEATIYVYNGGEEDYVMTFAGLTQKDGSFLVSRKKYKNFKLTDLKGKTVIGGRAGGMPEMTLKYAILLYRKKRKEFGNLHGTEHNERCTHGAFG